MVCWFVLELTWSRINEEWYVGMGWKDVDLDEEGFVRAEVQVGCGDGRMVRGWKRGDEKKIVGCSTGTSREVTHPSTIPAQRRLTSEF